MRVGIFGFFFESFKKSKNNNPAHVTACSCLKEEGDKGGDMSWQWEMGLDVGLCEGDMTRRVESRYLEGMK